MTGRNFAGWKAIAAAAATTLFICGGAGRVAAAADEFGCPDTASAYAGLRFDDTQHRLWYRRFWTGTCQGLPFLACFSGRPYWSETMQRMLQKLSATQQANARLRLCAVGKLVGHEWAKDNSIRRIDTRLVSQWIDRLEGSSNPLETLDTIEAEAQERLHRH